MSENVAEQVEQPRAAVAGIPGSDAVEAGHAVAGTDHDVAAAENGAAVEDNTGTEADAATGTELRGQAHDGAEQRAEAKADDQAGHEAGHQDSHQADQAEDNADNSAGNSAEDLTGDHTGDQVTSAELEIPHGFEQVATEWWAAVAQVHRLLLNGDAGIDTVTAAYTRELRARWEYAKALHQGGYQVPEYLAERAPVAPLWPTPQPPARAGALATAA